MFSHVVQFSIGPFVDLAAAKWAENEFLVKKRKIVFCWNNCSGYSQEKCFKCNLVFPKLSRLKKGQ